MNLNFDRDKFGRELDKIFHDAAVSAASKLFLPRESAYKAWQKNPFKSASQKAAEELDRATSELAGAAIMRIMNYLPEGNAEIKKAREAMGRGSFGLASSICSDIKYPDAFPELRKLSQKADQKNRKEIEKSVAQCFEEARKFVCALTQGIPCERPKEKGIAESCSYEPCLGLGETGL